MTDLTDPSHPFYDPVQAAFAQRVKDAAPLMERALAQASYGLSKTVSTDETAGQLGRWVRTNAWRIYDALKERGWNDDSATREALFELAAFVLDERYEWIYNEFMLGHVDGWKPVEGIGGFTHPAPRKYY